MGLNISEKHFIIYIFPAFFFFLISIAFEFLLLEVIYFKNQEYYNNNEVGKTRFLVFLISKFLIIYFILYFTNCHFLPLLSLSLLAFPQVYTNAIERVKPKNNQYYYYFLIFPRHLFIVIIYSNIVFIEGL